MSLLLLFLGGGAPVTPSYSPNVVTGAAGFTLSSSTDGITYTAIDGARTYGVELHRDMLDVSNFKEITAAHARIASEAETNVQISGNVVFASGSLSLDTGIKNLLQRLRDGGTAYVQRVYPAQTRGMSGRVSEFTLAADVDGAVTFATKIVGDGVGWA